MLVINFFLNAHISAYPSTDEFAFIVTPQNILTASLGSVVTFHCRPNQGEVAFWRKDGTTQLNSFSNSNSITITDIGFEDAGVYSCVVVVSGSRIEEASARLTVLGKRLIYCCQTLYGKWEASC